MHLLSDDDDDDDKEQSSIFSILNQQGRKSIKPLPPLQHQKRSPYPGKSLMPASSSGTTNNSEMITLLLRRMRDLEANQTTLKTLLNSREKRIDVLEAKVEQLQRLESADISDSEEEEISLIKTISETKQKLYYIDKQIKEEDFPFDMELIKNCISHLNVEAGEGTSHATSRDPSGAGILTSVPSAYLAVYKDGIFFLDGPFRRFTEDKAALGFLQDILDGYYPSEIKELFSEGTPFLLDDRHKEAYESLSSKIANSNTIKSVTDSSKSIPATTKESFLRKIPKQIIRNGQVVCLRDDINNYFEKDKEMGKKVTMLPSKNLGPFSLRVQVSSNQVFQIDGLGSMESIADIFEYIDKDKRIFTFKLSRSPKLINTHLSLQEANLTPKSYLHLCKLVR